MIMGAAGVSVSDVPEPTSTQPPHELARESALALAGLTGVDRHDVALVLGSGWSSAADLIGDTIAEIPATEIPGFSPPAVEGHVGTIRSIRMRPAGDADTHGSDGVGHGRDSGHPAPDGPGSSPPEPTGAVGDTASNDVGSAAGTSRSESSSCEAGTTADRYALVLGARTHLYEGRGVRAVVHGIRTAAAAGASTVVLTNGCGGLRPEWAPGTPVLISDHINLTATSPLEGATFVDLTDLYSARLRSLARTVDSTLDEGVYVQFRGPHYETPAEVQFAKRIGGDLVGMSTALEAIAARESGLEVLGISLVTNLAAGISPTPLSHAEVVEAGKAAAPRISQLLARIVALLP